jgi:hypothetical protein
VKKTASKRFLAYPDRKHGRTCHLGALPLLRVTYHRRMALTSQALTALKKYIARADTGSIGKDTIYKAVVLTTKQRIEVTQHLQALWNNPDYQCPDVIDLKPRHGYESRVIKDGFPSEQYIQWLLDGCSDQSGVAIDDRERPRLETGLFLDYVGAGYHIHVPIRSDARGVVYVDDVIPKGLASGSTKK